MRGRITFNSAKKTQLVFFRNETKIKRTVAEITVDLQYKLMCG